MGRRAVREIDAAQGQLGGRGAAHAGHILGIIGSVLLGLSLLVIATLLALLVIASSSTNSGNISALLGA